MKECPECNTCFDDGLDACPKDKSALKQTFAGSSCIEGKYQIEHLLGYGGMGAVYKAIHIMLNKPFAIKVIRPEFIKENPIAVNIFKKEAKTNATIRHPNVVSVTDFGITSREVPYLVMEYIDGLNLHSFLKDNTPLDMERLIIIFSQICAGLDNVHKQGIIHRDIKPDNILIDASLDLSESVKVSDFGLAEILAGGYSENSRDDIRIWGGNPIYMSPEQCGREKYIDHRSDIYNLGLILYYALTGRVPFWGTSDRQIIMKQINDPPDDPMNYNPEMPKNVSKAILKALSKDRADRFETTMELLAELKAPSGKKTLKKKKEGVFAAGIDLGTSNSVISVMKDNKPSVISIDRIERIMPSAVSFRTKEKKVVGSAAFRRAVIDPEHTILNVKKKMGDTGHRYVIYDSFLTPIEISSMILQKLLDSANKFLNHKIEKAVITVPAYFNEGQRKATKEAGALAGLKTIALLSEPTAAAIAYGIDKNLDQTIMVYDLGGGTFDVSILKVINNDFEILAVGGNHDLGGNDFDKLLMNHVISRLRKEEDIDLYDDSSGREMLKARQRLLLALKTAKEELSEALKAAIDLPNLYEGKSCSMTITRTEFENMIKPSVEKTIAISLSTLKDVNLDADDIDRLVLVGGSTRIPIIKKLISEVIREPFIAHNVDEIVAEGAAIFANNLKDDESRLQLNEVTAHTIGIGLLDESGELVCVHSIHRHSPLPAKSIQMAATVHPFQKSVVFPIFRGETNSCSKNDFIGELLLEINEPKEHIISIQITLFMTPDGILEVKAAEIEYKDNELEPQIVQTVKTVFYNVLK